MTRQTVRRTALMLLLTALTLCVPPLSGPAAQAKEESKLTVYFPNWNVYSLDHSQVKDLPWGQMDAVNHAFWQIVPENGGYAIRSTDPWADTDPDNPKAHFPQYAKYAEQYPQVRILLSIGGWNCCGYFSEMCLTKESRASFIQSCVDTLKAYPFLSGVDLDWEYPGAARTGGGQDQGNPVLGDDRTNYTLLLRETRAALDEAFGPGKKQLTVCASASVSTLKLQDYAALFPYVDRVNLMTYDMTGPYDPVTGHHAPLFGPLSADTAVLYLQKQGVPAAKIAVGSPLYGYGWKMTGSGKDPLGAPAKGLNGTTPWRELKALEAAAVPAGQPGWHTGYDEAAQAAYLWNDDPASPAYRYFYTYENEQSLDARLQYVRLHGLGGLIVWQSGGDSPDGWPMLTRMDQGLHP